MLPFEEKKTPMTVVDGSTEDLVHVAKKRSLQRIMEAFKANNIDKAYEALEDLLELCEVSRD